MCNCKEMTAKFERLDEIIARHKEERGALIPILHQAQEVFGYLPYEVQERIAEGLGISMAKVYGVVTFYSQFSLKKKGKYRINVCMGTACCRCIGACGLAPVATINDEVYGRLTPEQVEAILDKYEKM